MPDLFEQFFAFIGFPGYHHVFQGTVFIEGDGSMKQQVGVAYGVHASVAEQATHMLFQFFAADE